MASLSNTAISTRISVSVLLLVLASFWVLAYAIAWRLERDMTQVLAAQQYSVASYMAEETEARIRTRIESLAKAANLNADLLGNSEALRDYLKQQTALAAQFKSGVVVLSKEGIGLADYPVNPNFIGASYADRDYFKQVMATGALAFGKPRLGTFTKRPVVAIATPVKDASGALVAVLVGYLAISDESMFGQIERATFGKTGYVAINAPKFGLIVTSSNPLRILDTMAKAGVNPMVDKFVEGYEGSGIASNSKGISTLTSGKQIPSAGWYVQIVLPTEEAFAPVREMQRTAYSAAALLSVLVAIAAWLIIRRTLRPLDAATRAIHDMVTGKAHLHELPQGGSDEVGRLVENFNLLVGQRQRIERSLQESREVFQAIQLSITESIMLFDAQGKLLAVNPTGIARYGIDLPDALGRNAAELPPRAFALSRKAVLDHVITSGAPTTREHAVNQRIYSSTYYPVKHESGAIEAVVVVDTDTTEQKKALELLESERCLAQATLNALTEHVCVVDQAGTILMVNRSWHEFALANGGDIARLGPGNNYLAQCDSAPEGSGEDAHVFAQGLRRVLGGEIAKFTMEYACNSSWERHWFTVNVLRAPSADGERAVIAHRNITERKHMEDQLREFATTDALTGLPNRRHLIVRMEEELARVQRIADTHAAVLMIDLDHFKQVNDTYGHAAGDAALKHFAGTMQEALRKIDIKGRFGGEEFAVLLPGTGLDAAVALAERLRRLVEDSPLQRDSCVIPLTVSIGVAAVTPFDAHIDAVINRADQALYRAKGNGRNQVAAEVELPI